jgi:hypothetical protein
LFRSFVYIGWQAAVAEAFYFYTFFTPFKYYAAVGLLALANA